MVCDVRVCENHEIADEPLRNHCNIGTPNFRPPMSAYLHSVKMQHRHVYHRFEHNLVWDRKAGGREGQRHTVQLLPASC